MIGSAQEEMSRQQWLFLVEYLVDRDYVRAALAAGYSESTASSQQLLEAPLVKKYLERANREILKQYDLTAERIKQEVACIALRDAIDFVDEAGNLVTDVRKLPPQARRCIDSIKQKRRRYMTDDGEEREETETELKLVSKATGLDMAMKHLGMYAEEKHAHEHTHKLDWDDLYTKPVKPANVIPGSLTLHDPQIVKCLKPELLEKPAPPDPNMPPWEGGEEPT